MELIDFILKAKKDTYASGKKSHKLDNGFEQFVYEEDGYTYTDTYYAPEPRFVGCETVSEEGRVIWVMNYFGAVLDPNVGVGVVYGFLKKAMSDVSKERPFRGPPILKEGKLEYKDESEGSIKFFRGTERIFFEGNEVYRLEYHGGSL